MLVFENLILGVEYSVLSICIKYLELYFPVIFKSIWTIYKEIII